MKMSRLLFANIRKMIVCHTPVFIILMLGLIVSATALSVYYAQSAAMANTLTAFTGTDRSVEFQVSGVQNKETFYELQNALNSYGKEVQTITLLSEENDAFDIIGIYSDKPRYIQLEAGEWLEESGDIIVPYQFLDGELSSMIGQKYSINAQEYTVCGVYNQNTYTPDQFSYRRMNASSFSGAGVAQPDSLSERDVAAVFMSYSDFVSHDYTVAVVRVRFAEPIRESEQGQITEYVSNHVMDATGDFIYSEQTMQSAATQVYSVDFYSKLMLYVLLVLLSLVNILSLYLYVIRKNKRQYSLFTMLGLTRARLYALINIEILIYAVVSYVIGWLLKDLIIQHTYLKYTVPVLDVRIFFIILLAFLALSVITVTVIANRTLNGREEQADTSPLALSQLALRLKLKGIYLALKCHTRYFTGLILFLQVFFVAFSFSYAVTYMYERGGQERFINRYFGGETTLYFVKNEIYYEYTSPEEISSEQFAQDYFYMQPLTQDWKKLNDLPGILSETEGVLDVGYINPSLMLDMEKNDRLVYGILFEYSPGLIKNVKMPMYRGEWLDTWADGVDILSSDYIPIMITQAMAEAEDLSVGDELPSNLTYGFFNTAPSYNEQTGRFDDGKHSPNYEATVKIVGILKGNTRQITLQSYPAKLDSILYPGSEKNDQYVFCPPLYLGNDRIQYDTLNYTDALLFVDDADRIDLLNQQLKDYGTVYSVSDLAKVSDQYFQDGSMEYYIHTILAVLLLFVGVGGYNTLMLERQKRTLGVYFSCGMPWKRAAFVLLTGNALLFLIGGAGGALWGMYSANSLRPMMEDSKLYSVLTGLALVVVLLLVSSVFTIWKMRKLSPVALMKKEDAD